MLPPGTCEADGVGCAGAGEACASSADCASGSCAAGECAPLLSGNGGSGPSNLDGSGATGFILTEDYQPSNVGGSSSVCVDLEVDFERIMPTVVFLIDRSGSMTQNFDAGLDRWETLVHTLTDRQDSLIKKLEGSVRFGMALYSSNGGFGDGSRECPILTSVDIALENFSSISEVLENSANGPSGDTPTAESMQAITRELEGFAEEGPKSIILATDGEPDTCDNPNANDDATRAQSVAAVAAARAAGISTHVISVGTEVSASHLKALAVAGAGGDTDAEAYTALDTADLENAFTQIIGSVRTCDFELEGTVEAAQAARGSVLLDGTALEFGDRDGWVMLDGSTVRLQGEACEAVKENADGISMSFPCDAIQIIPR